MTAERQPDDRDTSVLMRAEAELALSSARREKSERTKNIGEPLVLSGKALSIEIRDQHAWITENTTVARKIALDTGKSLQVYRGHTAPVTCLAFYPSEAGPDEAIILLTGSWDKSIKLWDTSSAALISSTAAHSDFVKALLVIPSSKLLVSSSSDKIVRFWDLAPARKGEPLVCVGHIASHTRPVECLEARVLSETALVLFTADTMGVIKVWNLQKEGNGSSLRWNYNLREELNHHRTRINEIVYGGDHLWTASTDETAQAIYYPLNTSASKILPPISHPVGVRAMLPLELTPLAEPYLITGAGDIIYVFDVSSPEIPELVSQTDAHWHDVTALRLWARKTVGEDGKTRVEPWIISVSLDSTIRRWRLTDLLTSKPVAKQEAVSQPPPEDKFKMSEDEERELAELLDD